MRYLPLAVIALGLSFVLSGLALAQDADSSVYQIDPNAVMPGLNHPPDDAAQPTSAADPAETGLTAAPEPATIGSLVFLGTGLALVALYRRWRKRVMG